VRFLHLLFCVVLSSAVAAGFPGDLPAIGETPPYPGLSLPVAPALEPGQDAGGGGGGAFGGNVTADTTDGEEQEVSSVADQGAASAPGAAASRDDERAAAAQDGLRQAAVSEAAEAASFGVWLVIFLLLVAIAGVVVWLRTRKNPLEHIK
jgi:hypothetical protein